MSGTSGALCVVTASHCCAVVLEVAFTSVSTSVWCCEEWRWSKFRANLTTCDDSFSAHRSISCWTAWYDVSSLFVHVCMWTVQTRTCSIVLVFESFSNPRGMTTSCGGAPCPLQCCVGSGDKNNAFQKVHVWKEIRFVFQPHVELIISTTNGKLSWGVVSVVQQTRLPISQRINRTGERRDHWFLSLFLPDTIIKAVLIFAEGIFEGESHVVWVHCRRPSRSDESILQEAKSCDCCSFSEAEADRFDIFAGTRRSTISHQNCKCPLFHRKTCPLICTSRLLWATNRGWLSIVVLWCFPCQRRPLGLSAGRAEQFLRQRRGMGTSCPNLTKTQACLLVLQLVLC